MKNEDYVNYIWHFKVEDNLDWEFCAGILVQDGYKVCKRQLKRGFLDYFKKLTGIEPYSKCPFCGNELLPRQSSYGYFVGCSGFPKCNFIATDKKPYKGEEDKK